MKNFLFVSFLGVTLLASPALAATSTATPVKAAVHSAFEARCGLLVVRVNSHISRLNERFAFHDKHYQTVADRLTHLISLAESQSLSVADLQKDSTDLEALRQQFSTDEIGLLAQLTTLSKVDCSKETVSDFRAQAVFTRSLADKLHTDAVAINTLLKKTILPNVEVAVNALYVPNHTAT